MIKGKTSSGFKFQINESTINDDYELLELLGELEENPILISKVIRKVLGPDAAAALKDYVRDENGVVSIQKMSEEITEIFTQAKALKK